MKTKSKTKEKGKNKPRRRSASPMKPSHRVVEVVHVPMDEGRKLLAEMDIDELGIPSISPVLDQRWRAAFKGRFLDPGDNERFLAETHHIITGLSDVTTQRAIYYAIRGAHPKWRYKGEPLGDEFYSHFVSWVMEKLQLQTGLTMQAMGVWAAPRGYIAGDGEILTARRGRIPLTAKPSLGFDLADEGVQFRSKAKKLIHFEKDAGFEGLTAGDFPKYVEAIFSTSQGQLSEAASKFLRQSQEHGLAIYAMHDGDPSGIQMQLLYGMATKNNCYMPTEFYPALVKPLGFYPSIGEALGLPPEDVSAKEDNIFNNLITLAKEKQHVFPELRRFGLDKEVRVIVKDRLKWEFQALNALHESAPKVYLVESLRVHEDEIKHVPDSEGIKETVLGLARENAEEEVEERLKSLAKTLYEDSIEEELTRLLRVALQENIDEYAGQIENELVILEDTDAENFREAVKAILVKRPDWYAEDVIRRLGSSILTASFSPTADLHLTRSTGRDTRLSLEVTDISAESEVHANAPDEREPITKTELVDAIEVKLLRSSRVRSRVSGLIRKALEDRFGAPDETW